MNVSIILGHPDNKSFNYALAETCKTQLLNNGHSVFFHDLYQEKFNPVHLDSSSEIKKDETVARHQKDLTNSDAIIIVHPNWWGQPPAIVKGWMDRVLVQDVAYKFETNDNGDHIPVGLLKAQMALVINTSNTSEEVENKFYYDQLETIWENRVFKFCGVKQFKRKHFRVIIDSDMSQRLVWLSEIQLMMNTYFPKV